jgi:hypothetical protein
MKGGFLRINGTSSGLQDQCPVAGDAGIPVLRNYRFAQVHVEDCPMLVDAVRMDATKPLDGLAISDVTGTCSKGMYLANIRHALLRGIHVTGVSGPLLNIDNVTGAGLKGAANFSAADYVKEHGRG